MKPYLTGKYKVINETSYRIETPERIVEILEKARANDWRLRIYYGDTDTGRDWEEINDVFGYIGRSTGERKTPLLIFNKRCSGGFAVLDSSIVKIRFSNKKQGGILYQHPKYHKGESK